MEINAIVQWKDTLETFEAIFKVGELEEDEFLDEQYFWYLDSPEEINSEFEEFTVVESDYESLMATLKEEFEEGQQNRFRNRETQSFDEWLENKIENL